MDTITKRFHISGLTPQITQKDLENRLSSFGDVKSVDGFGKLDANGSPRPFAFVTLEGNKSQLSRCANLLSGTVWKGAKLRIGDAKLDYRERLEKEKETEASSDRPKKRRRLMRGCQGKLSSDMTPVSIENFSTKHGWMRTPAGRLIRPMRMRPLHPLPSGPNVLLNVTTKSGLKGKRRRRRAAPERARRKLINPVLWGSEYVKGPLLDSFHLPQTPVQTASTVKEDENISEGSETDEMDESTEDNGKIPEIDAEKEDQAMSGNEYESNEESAFSDTSLAGRTQKPAVSSSEFAQETAQGLALLNSIFGSNKDNWGGEESLSDVDMNEVQGQTGQTGTAGQAVDEDDFEIVPKEKDGVEKSHLTEKEDNDEGKDDSAMSTDEGGEETDEVASSEPSQSQIAAPQMDPVVKLAKLKDMFKLHDEQEVGFSIMDNLESEIDIDDEFDNAPKPMVVTHVSEMDDTTRVDTTRVITTTTNEKIVFDPNQTLFFPRDRSKDSESKKPRLKDIFDVMEEKGLLSSPVQTPEERKAWWQSQKVELTRFWKKHHREAVKQAKRRGGGAKQSRD